MILSNSENEIETQAKSGDSTAQVEEWADAQMFSRQGLVVVVRILLDEITSLRDIAEPDDNEKTSDAALKKWIGDLYEAHGSCTWDFDFSSHELIRCFQRLWNAIPMDVVLYSHHFRVIQK